MILDSSYLFWFDSPPRPPPQPEVYRKPGCHYCYFFSFSSFDDKICVNDRQLQVPKRIFGESSMLANFLQPWQEQQRKCAPLSQLGQEGVSVSKVVGPADRSRLPTQAAKQIYSSCLLSTLFHRTSLAFTVLVRYHCGGWSEEVNSRIFFLSYMVYL